MKYVKLKFYFFIFLFMVLIPLNASAEMGDKASKKWPQLFKQVRLIEEHINNLEVIQIKGLQNQLEDLLRQIEEIKKSVPQLQNVVELNKIETLAQVNKVETKISDLGAELKNQVLFKINQQKKILDKIQEDQQKLKLGLAQDIERFEKLNKENFQTQISQQNKILNNIREDQQKLKLGLAQDIEKFEKLNEANFQIQISQQNKILSNIREDQQNLKLGLAQDLEKFEKLNKENFQTFALGNKSNLEKIAQKLDSLEETTIKNFEGTKGLIISQLIPTIKDNQAKVHDDLLASRKTNDEGLKRLSDENQKLSKELSSILRENLIQGIDTKNQVESIDKNVAAASQNIEVNNKNLRIADEKINKLAETMKSLQVQHFASSATLEALKKDLSKAQEFDQLADEKINKLIKNSTQLTVHANQLEKTVINELQQSLNKADSSQDKINLANERLTLLIEILKAIAKEQDKLAQAVKVQSGLNKAQAGLIKNQESIKEALADLRRKANLSLSKSDNIKKTLGAMKKK